MSYYRCHKCGWPDSQPLPNTTVWHHCESTPGHDVTKLDKVSAHSLVTQATAKYASRVRQLLGVEQADADNGAERVRELLGI
jgi:hypothetical protein